MSRDDLHFRLRIPEELKKLIEVAAAKNKRSMTAEIIARIERTLVDDAQRENEQIGEKMRGLDQSIAELGQKLERLTSRIEKTLK